MTMESLNRPTSMSSSRPIEPSARRRKSLICCSPVMTPLTRQKVPSIGKHSSKRCTSGWMPILATGDHHLDIHCLRGCSILPTESCQVQNLNSKPGIACTDFHRGMIRQVMFFLNVVFSQQ